MDFYQVAHSKDMEKKDALKAFEQEWVVPLLAGTIAGTMMAKDDSGEYRGVPEGLVKEFMRGAKLLVKRVSR